MEMVSTNYRNRLNIIGAVADKKKLQICVWERLQKGLHPNVLVLARSIHTYIHTYILYIHI